MMVPQHDAARGALATGGPGWALEVATALAEAGTIAELARVVAERALDAIGGSAACVALVSADGTALELAGAVGMAPEILREFQRFSLEAPLPLSDAVRSGEGVWLGSALERDTRYPAIAGRPSLNEAWAALPLLSRGRAVGGLALSFERAREFDPAERALLGALAGQCANAIERVRSAEAADRSSRRLSILAEASERLAATLEPEATLASMVSLVVPRLSDWCAVHTLEGGPQVPLAVAHADPALIELLWGTLRRYPAAEDAPRGTPRVMREGVVEAVPILTDSMLAAFARDPEHLSALRRLGIASYAVVPMIARGRVVGAITLASAEPGRHGPDDLEFVLELARRGGVALDNARLHSEVLEANRELERRVEARTLELEAARRDAEVLTELSNALEETRAPAEVSERALGVLAGSGQVDLSWFALARLEDDRFMPFALSGEPPPGARELLARGVARGEGAIWRTLGGQPEYLERTEVPGYAAAGVAGVALVPLPAVPGRAPTVLCAYRPGKGRAWSRSDRALLEGAARSIGLALERTESAERLADKTIELEARTAEQETFVYTVSHDLRAPLLAMQGMGELLGDAVQANDHEEARFLLSRVLANVEKMGQLLNDLLSLSRVGRGPDEAVPLDLGEAVRAALADLEPRLLERGVNMDLARDWPSVLYPPSELYQLIANLLGNAAKFAGSDGAEPVVRVGWAPDGELVRLTVQDNGPGIASEYRERVFGLFQKLDARAEGTGVGLAIVRRIAERHGGRAWVEDSELGGACLAVTLPSA